MAQITLISIYLPLILSLMPFPLIVPYLSKNPSVSFPENKRLFFQFRTTKPKFLPYIFTETYGRKSENNRPYSGKDMFNCDFIAFINCREG